MEHRHARQSGWFGFAAALLLVARGAGAQPVGVTDPLTDELIRATGRLVEIVREDSEEGGPGKPIIIDTKCDGQRQWWTQRCENKEAIVPFLTAGPGSALWLYVALFRIIPPEQLEFERTLSGLDQKTSKHVALVTFAFVPEPFGSIDWTTAHVEDGHVIVQTRHWTDRDGHSNPSGPGVVRIDLDGGLRLTNLP